MMPMRHWREAGRFAAAAEEVGFGEIADDLVAELVPWHCQNPVAPSVDERRDNTLPPSLRFSQPDIDRDGEHGSNGRNRWRIEVEHGCASSCLPRFPLLQARLIGRLRFGIGRNRADVVVEDAGQLFSCFLDGCEGRRVRGLAFPALLTPRLFLDLQLDDRGDQCVEIGHPKFDIGVVVPFAGRGEPRGSRVRDRFLTIRFRRMLHAGRCRRPPQT